LNSVQYAILGRLEVTDAGRRLDIGTRRQRQLLAVLLLDANRVVSLDRLIDELWGDTPPNAATASIQAYISNLRRVLEPGRGPREPSRVLVTEPPGYTLRVNPEQIDARACEKRVAEAASCAALGQMAEAAQLLHDGLAMWRGEPLADFAYDSFAAIEIARLRELRTVAQERWVEAQLALDDVSAEVFATIDRVVAANPLRETARALQMVALYRRGRQTEALRVYEDIRHVLAEEVGLEPGPGLRALQHRVLVQDPALGRPLGGPVDPPQTPIRVGVADMGSSRDGENDAPGRGAGFVGRVEILSRLHELALAADDGRPRFALIGGEPGVGKTRLAEELCARLDDRATMVAWGRAHDDDGAPPLWPWVQVLRDFGVQAGDLTEHERDTLGALLPELAGNELPTADPNMARYRLFDAVRGVLARVGAERRCVIVLDDAQWADASAMRLLRFLATEPFGAKLLIVGLFHEPTIAPPGSFGAMVVDLAHRSNVDRYTLAGLDVADVAQLVEARTGLSGSDLLDLATRLHARTNGNAFFLTELIGLLGSEHRLDSAALDAVASDIPTIVADVIRRRAQRLPLDSQAALAVAAVIGREFSLDVLQVATGLDEERAFEAMEAALMTRTVVETGEGRYCFAHSLVNDTLYHDLSVTRRARLHGRVAAALEGQSDAAATQLAHHYRLAGDSANTARYSERAAEIAERTLAFDEAAENLETALSVGADVWTPGQKVDLLVRLSNALKMAGQPVLGADAADRALDIASRSSDPELMAFVARSCGEVNLWQVRRYGVVDDRTVSTLDRMLELLPAGDAVNRAHLMVALALSLYYSDDARPRGLDLIRGACAIARRSDVSDQSPELLAQTLVESLVYLATEPDPTEQLAVLDELVRVHDLVQERAAGTFDGTPVLLRGQLVRLSIGDANELDQVVTDAGKLAEARNDRVATAFCVWAQASVAFLRGRYSDAEHHATAAFDLHRALGIWGAPETFALHMILIWREQGRLVEMAPIVEPLLEEAAYPRAHKMLGLFASERGEIARIVALLGDDPVPRSRDFPWLVEVCLTAELAATAALPCRQELYDIMLPFAARVATMEATYVCLGSVSHYLGLLADSLGLGREAVLHARDGLEMNERIGAIPWIQRSRALVTRLADTASLSVVS
jgi:DNA-binding SARP family transcriptional activator